MALNPSSEQRQLTPPRRTPLDIRPILSMLSRHKIAALLVIFEIAISCAIICNAVFIISNRIAQIQLHSGVAEDELVYLATSSLLPDVNYDALRKQDLAALAAVPGVKAVSSINQIPYGDNVWGSGISLQPDQSRPSVHASNYMDDGQLLPTFGLQLREGRGFKPDEYLENSAFAAGDGAPLVPSVLLSQSLATFLFPDGNALGRNIYVWGSKPTQVVGVIEDLLAPGEAAEFGNRFNSMVFPIRTHYNVGGNTKFWGSVLYRLRREDFGELAHVDGVSPAWPIDYDTLAPYYDQAERMYEVHGAIGDDPTEPTRGPYPHPPIPHADEIARIVERAARIGRLGNANQIENRVGDHRNVRQVSRHTARESRMTASS